MKTKLMLAMIHIWTSHFAYAETSATIPIGHNEVKIIAEVFTDTAINLNLIKSQTTEAEFKEISDILKAEGVDAKTKAPKMTVNGTKVRVEGIANELELKNFGEIYNGKSYFKFRKGKSTVANFKALIGYLKTGNLQTSMLSLVLPSANAGEVGYLGYAAGFFATAFTEVHLALGGIFLVVTGATEAVPMAAGATCFALAAALYYASGALFAAGNRADVDASLKCVNGDLQIVFPNNDGSSRSYSVNNGERYAQLYLSKVDTVIRAKICHDGGTLAALQDVYRKSLSMVHTSDLPPVEGAR